MNKIRKIASVAIVFALVSLAAYGFANYEKNKLSPIKNNLVLGPRINVDPPLNHSENDSVTLQIFVTPPSAISPNASVTKMFMMAGHSLLGLNISDNPYYVQLLNVTFNTSHSTFFLSPEFYNVVSQWNKIFTNRGNIPSMTVQATKDVWNNTSDSIFTYYNNLPFQPWKIPKLETLTGQMKISNFTRGTNVNTTNFSSLTYAPYNFDLNLSFPSIPAQVIPINQTKSAPSIQTFTANSVKSDTNYYTRYFTTSSTSVSTYDTITGSNITIGYLPIIIAHLSRAVATGHSLLSLGGNIVLSDTTIGINSDNYYVTSAGQSSISMSVSPSDGVITGQNGTVTHFEAPSSSSVAYPYDASNASVAANRTTAYIGLNNITYEFVKYTRKTTTTDYTYYWKQTYYYEVGKGLVFYPPVLQSTTSTSSTTTDGNGVAGGISHAGINGYMELVQSFLPIEVNTVLAHFLGENASPGNFTLNGYQSVMQSSVYSGLTGYTNAENEIQLVNDGLTAFSTEIGVGLALTDTLAALNGADFDASEPSIVAISLEDLAAVAGAASFVLSSMASISFYANVSGASVSTDLTNIALPLDINPSNYTITDYQSSTPLSFTYSGQQYDFSVPNDYYNATAFA